jgi:LytS/YehU family sensor histidine kinase
MSALASGVLGVAPAALLSVWVWRVCKRNPWPLRLRPSFYFLHLAFAVVYAITWTGATRALRGMQPGQLIPREFFSSRLSIMQVLTGIALYGVIAGVSYAVLITRELREKEQLAAQAQTLAVTARLDALRARLNPHFLFNTLHTLAALVRYEPSRADQAFEQLGDMLRYILTENATETVSLASEWHFASKYLEFQKLRLGARLRVVAEMHPDAGGCSVPTFAVQTLVENAIRHSIEPNPAGGCVRIHAAGDGKTLTIRVSNDAQSDGTDIETAGHQIGLQTLRERLATTYGDAATLETTGGDREGFCVTLRLPVVPVHDPLADVDV